MNSSMNRFDAVHLDPGAWPTLNELRDVTAMMTADTILQILHGQAYYYGYDVDRSAENKIPTSLDQAVYAREQQQSLRRGIRTKMQVNTSINQEEYRLQQIRLKLVKLTARCMKMTTEQAIEHLKETGSY